MIPLFVLDRPIAFHRCFVELTGSVTGALLLSQAIYWQNRCKSHDGWWWKTAEEWQEETGMSRRELETARSGCRKFIEYEVRGIPAKGFYRVRVEAVQTSMAESAKLDCTKPPNLDGGKRQSISTETTSETTTESTYPPSPLKSGDTGRLRNLINGIFKRKESTVWTYEEESALASVCRRPEWEGEFSELSGYFQRCEKRFFPRSVASLLEKWNSTLDASRRAPDRTPEEQRAINRQDAAWIPPIPRSMRYEEPA